MRLAALAVLLAIATPPLAAESADVRVRILGVNDFHGQISAGRKRSDRPVGSAAVLAAWLRDSMRMHDGPSFVALAGDCVGASPASSALLQDEPTISFLNLLANEYCSPDPRASLEPRCNVVAALGNHEFDEGRKELLRLWRGRRLASGAFLDRHWKGARFPLICANVIIEATGLPLVPPSAVQDADGVPLAFVGAVVRSTPSLVFPDAVRGLTFLDEADAINEEVRRLRARRVHAVVVVIHEGGRQDDYEGWTRDDAPEVGGRIRDIVRRLDPGVDLVVSGHVHQFTNARLPRERGEPVLVTQAWSAGMAFADIELVLSRATRDVTSSRARILTAWADEGPGLRPEADALALTQDAERVVAPLVERVVGTLAGPATRAPSEAGESALGNLVADAQRAVTGADVAFMNPGGLRADIDAGPLTWGEIFTAQPFGNTLVTVELRGSQIREALEAQFARERPLVLQVSGLAWTREASAAAEARVADVRVAGVPLDDARSYRVTINSFLAAGGDGFEIFTQGRDPIGGGLDVDAIERFLKSRNAPVLPAIDGRIALSAR